MDKNWAQEDTGLGKKGGNTRAHQKKDFGVIPYFLEIANVGESHF